MKKNRVTRSYLLKSANKDYQPIVITYIISAVCHLGVFGILVFVPGYSPARKWSPSVVSVNLVSLPAPGPVSQREIPVEPEAPVAKVDQKVEKIPDPVVPKPVESKPVFVEKKQVKKVSISEKKRPFKPKKSLKKKTYKASKVIKSAINRIEKKTARKKTDPLAKAMSNLKKKIASGRPSSSGGTGSGGGGKRALEQIDIYKIEIAFQIQKNWAFSTQLAGDRKDLEARLLIKIMSQGEILEIDFETKSGNTYFDESAYKAVQKSDPLPPLPRGYRRPFFIVGLRFTPSGLN